MAMLRSRDLAVLLDMTPDDVNLKARKGVIKGFKRGNQWRFRDKEVKRLLGTLDNQPVPRQ